MSWKTDEMCSSVPRFQKEKMGKVLVVACQVVTCELDVVQLKRRAVVALLDHKMH